MQNYRTVNDDAAAAEMYNDFTNNADDGDVVALIVYGNSAPNLNSNFKKVFDLVKPGTSAPQPFGEFICPLYVCLAFRRIFSTQNFRVSSLTFLSLSVMPMPKSHPLYVHSELSLKHHC